MLGFSSLDEELYNIIDNKRNIVNQIYVLKKYVIRKCKAFDRYKC